MTWNKTTDKTPDKGVHVIGKIRYIEEPVVVYIDEDGNWIAETEHFDISYCSYGQGGTIEQEFESSEVTHWCAIPTVPTWDGPWDDEKTEK